MRQAPDYEFVEYKDNPGVYSVWNGNVQIGALYFDDFKYRHLLPDKTWGPLVDMVPESQRKQLDLSNHFKRLEEFELKKLPKREPLKMPRREPDA